MTKSIAEQQSEYAARPYAVRLVTSHFTGTFRFHTLSDAIAYIQTQYDLGRKRVLAERYTSFDAHRSVIVFPSKIEVSVSEFIGDDLSSY